MTISTDSLQPNWSCSPCDVSKRGSARHRSPCRSRYHSCEWITWMRCTRQAPLRVAVQQVCVDALLDHAQQRRLQPHLAETWTERPYPVSAAVTPRFRLARRTSVNHHFAPRPSGIQRDDFYHPSEETNSRQARLLSERLNSSTRFKRMKKGIDLHRRPEV